MIGVLEEVKFFIDYFSDKSLYNDNLKLQGSNVGFDNEADIITIHTIGAELHEGWNYYNLKAIYGDSYQLPEYRYYRLFNEQSNGCDKIGEVTFLGTQAFTTDVNTHTCSTVVSGDDFEEQDLTSNGGASVTY